MRSGSVGTSRGRPSPASFIPTPFWSPSRRGAGPEDSTSRGALVGDCYVRKKPPRTKSVDNLNYISHHNPREPVKPTPTFCPGAPRVGSSEWAPACHAEVTPPLRRSLFVASLFFFVSYFPSPPRIVHADRADDRLERFHHCL